VLTYFDLSNKLLVNGVFCSPETTGDTAAPYCSLEITGVGALEVAIMDSCNALKLPTENLSSASSCIRRFAIGSMYSC
jgi:hypothetical protein